MENLLSNSTPNNAAVLKTPEADIENLPRIPPSKPSPFSNGVLKGYAPLHIHHGGGFKTHHPVVVTYKECLKNHAARLGGHAVDGCGEFMQSPASNVEEPTLLKCAACGCHRNFHRREPDEPQLVPRNVTPTLEYQPRHRHHPLPPVGNSGSSPNNSPPPQPISSSYFPSTIHMLDSNAPIPISASSCPNGRKRFRTKFTQDQKRGMLELAERIGWKMQKKDEDLISGFCTKTEVDRGVFKVWMHNNKNTCGKKDQLQPHLTDDKSKNTNGIGYVSIGGSSPAASSPVDFHSPPRTPT